MTKKTMTCENFADQLINNYFFEELIDEQYWSDGFKSEPYFKQLKEKAAERGVELSDSEDFDYDTFFYNLYKSSEKGLS